MTHSMLCHATSFIQTFYSTTITVTPECILVILFAEFFVVVCLFVVFFLGGGGGGGEGTGLFWTEV